MKPRCLSEVNPDGAQGRLSPQEWISYLIPEASRMHRGRRTTETRAGTPQRRMEYI